MQIMYPYDILMYIMYFVFIISILFVCVYIRIVRHPVVRFIYIHSYYIFADGKLN